MRPRLALAASAAATMLLSSPSARADNPIVQTNYTADPAAMVYNDVLYVFTGHDEDLTVNNFFTMSEWRVYSTIDMVNWTDHGSPMSYRTFAWATGNAWAAQPIFRNGMFYYYAPVKTATATSVIGVAVADNPIGPYRDAIGKPLIASDCGDIDPTPFIDDDGQAYLYWGNPRSCYVTLNSDMVSYAGTVNHVPMTTASFGVRPVAKANYPTLYEEGPWFFKRSGLYYLAYASDCCGPEKIDYSTSPGPTGPWTYRGRIYTSAGSASFTNQTAIVDYRGHSYAFYHNGALPGGGGYKRSACIEEFHYNADGTIPTIPTTALGPSALANLNPFAQTEAETMAFSSGLKTEVCREGGMDVTSINNGDYIKIRSVDFGSGVTAFNVRVASDTAGGNIEARLDSLTGPVVATCSVQGTGDAQTWATRTCPASGATGVHDLFLRFVGSATGTLFNFNWWRFDGPGGAVDAGIGDGSNPPRDATAGDGGRTGAAGGAPGGDAGVGTGTGGVAGSGGRTGTGGTAITDGGRTGAGGSSGSSGQAGTSGRAGSAGGNANAPGNAAGCGCRSGPAGGGGGWSALGTLVLMVARLLRRRRHHPAASN